MIGGSSQNNNQAKKDENIYSKTEKHRTGEVPYREGSIQGKEWKRVHWSNDG